MPALNCTREDLLRALSNLELKMTLKEIEAIAMSVVTRPGPRQVSRLAAALTFTPDGGAPLTPQVLEQERRRRKKPNAERHYYLHGKYWHWGPDWIDLFGPFDTEEECRQSLIDTNWQADGLTYRGEPSMLQKILGTRPKKV
jgi:hypothetical protein